jgi:DNA (cytosine-5)-methyltransferase 1
LVRILELFGGIGAMTQALKRLNGVVLKDYKIRKLTPKECWRLMGFSDEVFEKAQKVNSNTQLYKQARKLNSS